MKTYRIIDVLLMVSAASLISCSPVIYSSVGTNTPMFKEKGELAINGSIAASVNLDDDTDADGFALQAAYAIDDRWAAIGSFYSLNGAYEPNEDYPWTGVGNYIELGGGRYGLLGTNGMFAYEVFGGIGTASIKNEDYINRANFLDVNFTKPFVQPSIGLVYDFFDLIFTPRFGYVIFSDPSYNFSGGQPEFDLPKDSFVFEPGVTLRLGYRAAKLQIQYNYSTYNYGSTDSLKAGVNSHFLSLGLHVLFSKRYQE